VMAVIVSAELRKVGAVLQGHGHTSQSATSVETDNCEARKSAMMETRRQAMDAARIAKSRRGIHVRS